MGYLLLRLIAIAILCATSIAFCICALKLPRWLYHQTRPDVTYIGLLKVCTNGICEGIDGPSEYFSYTLIMMCFAVIFQFFTFVSVLMGIRVCYFNYIPDGCCQWDIFARFGLCSSLTALSIASILFLVGLTDAQDVWGGGFEVQWWFLVQTIKHEFKGAEIAAGQAMCHFFLSASMVMDFLGLWLLTGWCWW